MATNKNTIALKGDILQRVTKEAVASAAIAPGNIATLNASGEILKETSAATPRLLVVLEQNWTGGTIQDAFAAADTVVYKNVTPGDEVNLRVASGTAVITAGDKVEVLAGGVVTQSSGKIIGYALETLDNSGGASDEFLAVEIA